MSTFEFYADQAMACSRAAQEAALPELRDKFTRSQIAWQMLADKKRDEAEGRERRLAEKEMQRTSLDLAQV